MVHLLLEKLQKMKFQSHSMDFSCTIGYILNNGFKKIVCLIFETRYILIHGSLKIKTLRSRLIMWVEKIVWKSSAGRLTLCIFRLSESCGRRRLSLTVRLRLRGCCLKAYPAVTLRICVVCTKWCRPRPITTPSVTPSCSLWPQSLPSECLTYSRCSILWCT